MADRGQAYEAKLRLLSEEIAGARALHAAAPADWRSWWDSSGASELRCILMTSWDALGVLDFGVWDEYDAYLIGVGNLLRAIDDEVRATCEITAFLAHVRLDFIGLSATDSERDGNAATVIVGWYGWSLDRGRIGRSIPG